MTNYTQLSQEVWRVSYTDDQKLPDVSMQKVYDGFHEQIPMFQMPVTLEVKDLLMPNGTIENRLFIKHQQYPYNLFVSTVQLRNFGTFVHAIRVNAFEDPPDPPDGWDDQIYSKTRLMYELGAGIIVILLFGPFTVMFLLEMVLFLLGACGLPLLIGIFLVIRSILRWRKSNEIARKRREYFAVLDKYWTSIQKIFLDSYDPTLYQLEDAANEVLDLVLKELYPQANVGEHKADDTKERAREEMQQKLAKYREIQESMKPQF